MENTRDRMAASVTLRLASSHGGQRAGAALVIFAVLTASQGCYSYYPAELARIQPGEQVRVVLEDSGYRRLAPGAAPESAPELEGDLRSVTEDSVALSVWIGQAYRGTPFQTAQQRVSLARDVVVRFERREISLGRTALAAAGVVGAVAYLISKVEFSPAANSDNEEPPAPPPSGSSRAVIEGLDVIGAVRALFAR